MQALLTLYHTSPFWVWFAIAAITFSVELVAAQGVLVLPTFAAALVGALLLMGVSLGAEVEGGVYFGAFVLSVIGRVLLTRRTVRAEAKARRAAFAAGPAPSIEAMTPSAPIPTTSKKVRRRTAAEPPVSDERRTERLIGRIARTTGDFANGVGRVWIDGAEWGAELANGGDELPSDSPVRVQRIIGGIRLQVCRLDV